MQKFIPYLREALGNEAVGSIASGMDIEFIDKTDGRKKYCQLKAGPNTINKDDISTIHRHFDGVRRLAQQNAVQIGLNDLVIGILYGEREELNGHYKALREKHQYVVLVGQEFWCHLTGDNNFYFELGRTLASVAAEIDGTKALHQAISQLAKSDIIQKLSNNE